MYIYILYIYTTCFYVYMYEYIYIYVYIYIYTNLPMDVIFRLPHPRSGDSQGQETFLAPSADKQTRNYDIECSNHHPSLSTLRPKGLKKIAIYIFYIYILNIRYIYSIFIHACVFIYNKVTERQKNIDRFDQLCS